MQSHANILSLVDKSGFGGVQTIANEMIRHNFGNKFSINFFYLRNINYKFKIDDTVKDNVLYSKSKKRYSLLPIFEIKNIITKKNINIIHCNGNKSLLISIFLKILIFKNIKIIEHEHGGIFDDKWIYFKVLRLLRKKIDYFITLTEYRKEILINLSKIEKNKIFVVPNFVDDKKYFYNNDSVEKYKKIIQYNKNEIYLGYLGGLSTIKGVDLLIKLMPKLNEHVKLIIFGDGPQKDYLIKLSKDIGTDKKVFFMGYCKNPPDAYALFNISLIPSRSEAFGIVILENWLNKKPIIVSDIPTLREIVIPGENGLMFKKNDIESLERQVNKMLADKKIAEKLIKNGSTAVKKYSFSNYCEKIMDVYDKCTQFN